MSQDVFSTPLDPAISGTTLATYLNEFKDAIMSGFSGTSRPAEIEAGGYWVDTTNNPTSWSYKLYTGSVDIEIFQLDLTSGAATVSLAADTFAVRKVSADSVGPIVELVKRRVATNGQVASGDVVGDIKFIGRTNTSANPVVAKIIFTADETQTDTTFGGTLSIQSTPEGQAALVEHMKFAEGIIESVVAHKLTSQILVSQNVATTATIAQLSAAKVVVEMTGSTATSIQGINSAHASKVVSVHNRSTATVTLKHQDGSATANDRLKLPNSADIDIAPQEAVTLFYCTTDTRWKVKYIATRFAGFQKDTVLVGQGWTAPAGVTKVRVFAKTLETDPEQISISQYTVFDTISVFVKTLDGVAFAWGGNTVGQLGVGNVVPRSSPVAVLSSFAFRKVHYAKGITPSGVIYSWGENNNGNLGLGDVTDRSSPVAVLGSRVFSDIYVGNRPDGEYVLGIEKDTGTLYAWGRNTKGQLGVGDTTARSSPVAVLGGLRFAKVNGSLSGGTTQAFSLGITHGGTLYAWGANGFGQLGVGDLTARSSPVAVLGGLKFKKVVGTDLSVKALTVDGDMYCWGDNDKGKLGVGDSTLRSSPVAVLGGLKFVDFNDSDQDSVYAVSVDGDGYAWGNNNSGQLGVGDFTERSSPVLILGGIKYKKIECGSGSAYGLSNDGVLYAWGSNTFGQLGTGNTTDTSSPVQVLGNLRFQNFVAKDGSIWAITEDGILYAWGVNDNGQLGVGDVTSRSSPVAVLGNLKLKPISRGNASIEMTVVPTTTYDLLASNGRILFGTREVPANTSYIEVEYL